MASPVVITHWISVIIHIRKTSSHLPADIGTYGTLAHQYSWYFFLQLYPSYLFTNTYFNIHSVDELDSEFIVSALTEFTFPESTMGYITMRVHSYKHITRQNNYKLMNAVVKINKRLNNKGSSITYFLNRVVRNKLSKEGYLCWQVKH